MYSFLENELVQVPQGAVRQGMRRIYTSGFATGHVLACVPAHAYCRTCLFGLSDKNLIISQGFVSKVALTTDWQQTAL